MNTLQNAIGNGPLKTWLENKLLSDVVTAGGDPSTAPGVLKEVLAQQSIWGWLLAGGWQQLVNMVLQILALLPKSTPAS